MKKSNNLASLFGFGIAIAIVIYGLAEIAIEMNNEVDASSYNWVNKQLKRCPWQADKLDELINDDGILSDWDVLEFKKNCSKEKRGNAKKRLTNSLNKGRGR